MTKEQAEYSYSEQERKRLQEIQERTQAELRKEKDSKK
jgi:hypothetical protein